MINLHNSKYRILVIIAAVVFLIGSTSVSFASTSVNISGKNKVTKGETYTVKVKFSGDNIGRVDGQLTYDTSKLSYKSGGSSSGDNGYIDLKDAGTGEAIVFNIKFKAKGGGSSTIKVTTNGIYNLEEEYIDAPSTSKSINIKGGETTTTVKDSDEDTSIEESDLDTETGNSEDEIIEDESNSSSNMKFLPFIMGGIAVVIVAIIVGVILFKCSNRRGKHSKHNR